MLKNIALSVIVSLAIVSCQQQEYLTTNTESNQIVASINKPADSRTAVDGAGAQGGKLSILWTENDQLGVFDATATSQKCYSIFETGSKDVTSFRSIDPFESPKYAYYPYNKDNDGKSITALMGNLPEIQNMDDESLKGDYKYGTFIESSQTGHSFVFNHIFSIASMSLNAGGTPLQHDKLKSLKITAKRNGTPVNISGDFTFNAQTGVWSQSNGANSNSITLEWTKNQPYLEDAVIGHICLFPNIEIGDIFEFEVKTDNYIATFTAPSKAKFQKETFYNFRIQLSNFTNLVVKDSEGKEITSTNGDFTCAAMNIDGLPQTILSFKINPDGPGEQGTTDLANVANQCGWDFFAVSENFHYNTQLVSALSNYSWTPNNWRGTISIAQITSQADTDGLGFFWKTNGVSTAGEQWIEFTDKKGGLTEGANETIKKGFRHYIVTVAEGVTVDVYITHMNTYEGKGNTEETNAFVAAQLSQLRQLRDYVLANANTNKRPTIIMGDTNMRYTRHQVYNNLIAPVKSAGYSIVDPWVKFNRNGKYPTWNTKSLMIRSKFAGDTENDIVCSDDQRGEVVDKMWYINVPGAPLQIEAASCINDVEHFKKSNETVSYSGVTAEDASGNILTNQTVSYTKYTGLADHFPVVVKFNYSLVQEKN